jgi:hypothetical protein
MFVELISRLRSRVGGILDRAKSLDFTLGPGEEGQIKPRTMTLLELLHQACAALTEVQRTFEDEVFLAEVETASEDDSLLEIGALISTQMAAQELGDLAFVARGDLRATISDLESSLAGADPWLVAAAADRSLRRLRKGLISVESSLYEFDGSSAPRREWYDLETSLEVRRLYGDLRRGVLRLGQSAGAVLENDLHAFARRLVGLHRESIYPLLRIDDRREIQRLAQRILNPDARRTPLDSQRLWQDVVGFVELLAQVSHREELRAYDHALLSQAHQELSEGQGDRDFLSSETLQALKTLRGLDDELDDLLQAGRRATESRWRACLERLLPAGRSAGGIAPEAGLISFVRS